MTDKELYFITNAIKEVVDNINEWKKDYKYSSKTNEFTHIKDKQDYQNNIKDYFML